MDPKKDKINQSTGHLTGHLSTIIIAGVPGEKP